MKNVSIYILLILFVAINGVIISVAKKYEPKYTVKNLVITNNHIIPTDVLLEFINVKDKETLSSLTAEMIVDRISKHPYVKSVEGVFVDSTTYVVRLVEIEPFLLVVTNGQNFILTKDKKLIPDDPRLNVLDLPVVTFTNNQIDVRLLKKKIIDVVFNSFKNIYKTDIALFEIISEMNVDDNYELTFYLTKPKGKVFVGKEIDEMKSVYLSEFWRKIILANPNEQYDYIDLRFSEQIVVKYSNSISS